MTHAPAHIVERVTVLHGHASPDTAHVVEDHPYRFGETCRKRYWVETSPQGRTKGQQRVVSQTTDPSKPHEHWNKARPGRYAMLTLICQDGAGNVSDWEIHEDDVRGGRDYFNRAHGVYDQLTADQREIYDSTAERLASTSKLPYHYDEWALAHVMDYIRKTGRNPRHVDGTWMRMGEDAIFMGRGDEAEAFFVYARMLLASATQA